MTHFQSKRSTLPQFHAAFLKILPTIERHARIAFASLPNWHDREDAVAETIAAAWIRYRSLLREGDEPAASSTPLEHPALDHINKLALPLTSQQSTGLRSKGISEPVSANGQNPVTLMWPPEYQNQMEMLMLPTSVRFHGAGQS